MVYLFENEVIELQNQLVGSPFSIEILNNTYEPLEKKHFQKRNWL